MIIWAREGGRGRTNMEPQMDMAECGREKRRAWQGRGEVALRLPPFIQTEVAILGWGKQMEPINF